MMILENGYSVITPCAIGRDGNTYNVTWPAGKIASILKAEKFVLLTDVSGVLKIEMMREVFQKLTIKNQNLNSFITKGMIPAVSRLLKKG